MAVRDFKDGISATGESATSSGYTILGGRYAFLVSATWGGGSAGVEMLMPDGSTYVPVMDPLTDDGAVALDLPAGTIRVAITTATAVQYALLPAMRRT